MFSQMMKKIMSAFTLQALYKKGFKNGSLFWRYGFFISITFKILKWLFSKPKPVPVEEFEIYPGQYRIVVDEQNPQANGYAYQQPVLPETTEVKPSRKARKKAKRDNKKAMRTGKQTKKASKKRGK